MILKLLTLYALISFGAVLGVPQKCGTDPSTPSNGHVCQSDQSYDGLCDASTSFANFICPKPNINDLLFENCKPDLSTDGLCCLAPKAQTGIRLIQAPKEVIIDGQWYVRLRFNFVINNTGTSNFRTVRTVERGKVKDFQPNAIPVTTCNMKQRRAGTFDFFIRRRLFPYENVLVDILQLGLSDENIKWSGNVVIIAGRIFSHSYKQTDSVPFLDGGSNSIISNNLVAVATASPVSSEPSKAPSQAPTIISPTKSPSTISGSIKTEPTTGDNTGAIAGGVCGALGCLALVALGVAKRRSQEGRTIKAKKGHMSSTSGLSQSAQDDDDVDFYAGSATPFDSLGTMKAIESPTAKSRWLGFMATCRLRLTSLLSSPKAVAASTTVPSATSTAIVTAGNIICDEENNGASARTMKSTSSFSSMKSRGSSFVSRTKQIQGASAASITTLGASFMQLLGLTFADKTFCESRAMQCQCKRKRAVNYDELNQAHLEHICRLRGINPNGPTDALVIKLFLFESDSGQAVCKQCMLAFPKPETTLL